MSLKSKLVNWAFGDTIRAEADRLARQAAASTGIDRDDHQWRGLLQSRRDLMPVEQDRLIEIANYLVAQNPLANKIRKTRRDFVIGDGVTFTADDDKEIQPIIDEFWCDPVNNMDEYQVQLVDYLGINGELLIPTFPNYFKGNVQLGWIDPMEVEQVLADRNNRRIMREVRMKPGASAGYSTYYDLSQKRTYQIVNVDLVRGSKTYGYRTGELLFFKINCAPDATRGRSDFEPVADLVDAWDQATFNDLERVSLLLNFIWDVKLTGKTEQQIEEWLRGQSAPAPGSIRAHNEGVEWQAIAPDLKFTETRMLANGIRKDVLGAMDLSEFFFGITEGANRASSENLETPILKALQARQRVVRAVFREMVDYAIDCRVLKNPKLKRQIESGQVSRKFKVEMPELSSKDVTRIGSVFTTMSAALDGAVERGWVSNDKAAEIFAAFAAQVGIEYNVEEERQKAEAEKAKRDDENEDYTPEQLAAAKALKVVA